MTVKLVATTAFLICVIAVSIKIASRYDPTAGVIFGSALVAFVAGIIQLGRWIEA